MKRILSFGGGVDSSAILLKHLRREINLSIDLVIFADTGAENKRTYQNVDRFKSLCDLEGIEFVIVKNQKETITEFLVRNGSVPLMAGSAHTCSRKFKSEVIQKYIRDRFKTDRVTYLIGIELNETKRQRFQKPLNDRNEYEYPLIELQMTRSACEDYLNKHGFNVVKSSCVFCPFMSREEILEIRKDPESWATIQWVEKKFESVSSRKYQNWIDAGKPLIILKTKKKDGTNKTRAPAGMWQRDSWKEGQRLFTQARHNGQRLSVEEWSKV